MTDDGDHVEEGQGGRVAADRRGGVAPAARLPTTDDTRRGGHRGKCQPPHLLAVAVAITVAASFFTPSAASTNADSLSFGSSLAGNETLISNGSVFELGFFTPEGASGRSYLGVWYYGIPGPTIVWVANRQSPVIAWTKLAVGLGGL